MGVMLSVKDLVVNYGAINAIKGISFDVNEGEIVTLIGANGAGKTTRSMLFPGCSSPNRGRYPFAASPSAAWKRIKSSSWA